MPPSGRRAAAARSSAWGVTRCRVLYLKQVEARSRGEPIAVSGVTADVGNVAACLPRQERPFINADPVDVEDWGMLTLTFSDGTKSTVFSGDMIMGGVRNVVETYTSGGALFANITPNNHMTSYLTDEAKLAGVYITEKVDRKTGWQFICLEEEWTRGYLQEIQDFMECVAFVRQPSADLGLAYETTKINYAAYWSAEEGGASRCSLHRRACTKASIVDSSCPALCRASTSCFSWSGKDVDGWDKSSHDGGRAIASLTVAVTWPATRRLRAA